MGEQALGADQNGQTFNKLKKVRCRREAVANNIGAFKLFPEEYEGLATGTVAVAVLGGRAAQPNPRQITAAKLPLFANIRVTPLPAAYLGRKLSSNQARKRGGYYY